MTTLVEQLINDLEAEITQRDARIEEQAREIETHAEVVAVESSLRASAELDLATLKSQSSGVALPIRKSEAAPPPFERGWNACLDEVARLNSPPTSAGDLFWKEKLAVKFCEQRCVSDDAPERAGLVDAFITGLSIGSKQPISAGVVDEREAFDKWLSMRGVWPRLTYEEVFIAGIRTARHDHSAQSRADGLMISVEDVDHLKHARRELTRLDRAPLYIRQALAQKITNMLAAAPTPGKEIE